jgi:hypothetical protein
MFQTDCVRRGQVLNEAFTYSTITGEEMDVACIGTTRVFLPVDTLKGLRSCGYFYSVDLMSGGNLFTEKVYLVQNDIYLNKIFDPRLIIPYVRRQIAFNPSLTITAHPLARKASCNGFVFVYSSKTGEILQDSVGGDPEIVAMVDDIMSVVYNEPYFTVTLKSFGVVRTAIVRYNDVTDIFDECKFDPRDIIPSIRISRAFLEINDSCYNPDVSGMTDPNYSDNYMPYHMRDASWFTSHSMLNNEEKSLSHIKYVDLNTNKITGVAIGGQRSYETTRVSYDARTGDELAVKLNGPSIPATYVDECKAMHQEGSDIIVTFLQNKEEHIALLTYNRYTKIFSDITADPRIIIPYVRNHPEFSDFKAPEAMLFSNPFDQLFDKPSQTSQPSQLVNQNIAGWDRDTTDMPPLLNQISCEELPSDTDYSAFFTTTNKKDSFDLLPENEQTKILDDKIIQLRARYIERFHKIKGYTPMSKVPSGVPIEIKSRMSIITEGIVVEELAPVVKFEARADNIDA